MVHRLHLLRWFKELRSTNLLCATLIQNTNFASGCKTSSNKYHTGLPSRCESQYWKKGREKKDKCMFRSWLLDVMRASERGTFTPFRTTWRAFSARSGWQTTVTWYSVWARSAARKLVFFGSSESLELIPFQHSPIFSNLSQYFKMFQNKVVPDSCLSLHCLCWVSLQRRYGDFKCDAWGLCESQSHGCNLNSQSNG
jgi:hypothetical protein